MTLCCDVGCGQKCNTLIFQPAELSAVWDVVCGYSLTARGPLLILLASLALCWCLQDLQTNMWHLYCSNAALCESPSKHLVKTYEEHVQHGSRARLGFRRPQLSYLRWQLSCNKRKKPYFHSSAGERTTKSLSNLHLTFSVFGNRVWLLLWSRSARGLRGPTRPQFPRCLLKNDRDVLWTRCSLQKTVSMEIRLDGWLHWFRQT